MNQNLTRRWRVLASSIVAMAVVTLITVLATAAYSQSSNPGDESRALGAFTRAFGGADCLQIDEATARVRQNLDELGLSSWTISSAAEITSPECVTVGVAADGTGAVLLPAVPGLAAAAERIAAELDATCLSTNEATASVARVLVAAGVADYLVRTDGPVAYPIGEQQRAVDRIAAGCTGFSGSGSDGSGRAVIYLTAGS